MPGSLDDMKAWNKDGKEMTPKEFIKEGVSRGFTQDGQVVLRIMMRGVIEEWTMLATNKKDFISMITRIADKVY